MYTKTHIQQAHKLAQDCVNEYKDKLYTIFKEHCYIKILRESIEGKYDCIIYVDDIFNTHLDINKELNSCKI